MNPPPAPDRGAGAGGGPGETAGHPVVIINADGGSRGNPGPAGYGAVVFAADGVTVLAERAAALGSATNNVAEYNGLIAGLEAARDIGATRVTARMDSKLVVEQMSGRWKVKHPAMRPLNDRATALMGGFEQVDFQWVPRAENSRADRLANEAMDAAAAGRSWTPPASASDWTATASTASDPAATAPDDRSADPFAGPVPTRDAYSQPLDESADLESADLDSADLDSPDLDSADSDTAELDTADLDTTPTWQDPAAALPNPRDGEPTRFVIVRHGETTWGAQARFAGRKDVSLTPRGKRQASAVAGRIARLAPDVVLTSPLQRCRNTAQAIAAEVGAPVLVDERLVDGTLGDWTGFRANEIEEKWPREFAAWRSDPDAQPPGGESFSEIRQRIRPLMTDALTTYRGHTVVLVTHAAPSKMILATALNVDSAVAYRVRVDTASLSGFTVEADGAVMVWAINDTGHLIG